MKSVSQKLIALLLCIVMVLGLVACGAQKAEDAPAADSPAADTPAADSPAADAPAAEPPADAKYQEKIVVANNNVFTNRDPYANNTLVNMHIHALTHSTLVDFDETNGVVVNDLLESYTMIDDTTYEFKLKDGVYFSNGEKLTSNDVKFTIEYAQASPQASRVAFITEVEVVDELTFRFKLTSPSVTFLTALAEPNNCILNEKAVTEDPEEGLSVGTGPYDITEWVPGDYIVVTAKEDYWGETPKTRIFEYRKVEEDAARTVGLQAGDLDIVFNAPAADVSYIAEDPNCTLMQLTGTQLNFICLNYGSELMSNITLRKAIQHAVNPDDVIIAAAEGYGEHYSTTFAPPCFGFSEDIEGYEYDPAKAKELLAEAGYPNGLTIRAVINGAQWQSILDVVQAQLLEVGITLDVAATDVALATEIINARDYDLTITRWAYGPSVDSGLRTLWFTDNPTNWQRVSDPTLEAMIEDACATVDDAERAEKFKEIQQYQMDLATMVPLYVAQVLIGTDKELVCSGLRADQRHDITDAYIIVE